MNKIEEAVREVLRELDKMTAEEINLFCDEWINELYERKQERYPGLEELIHSICNTAIERVNKKAV